MLQWAVKCVVLFSEKYAIMAFAASYANPLPQCFCSQSNRVCLRYFQNKCLPCRYVRFCERLRIHNTRFSFFRSDYASAKNAKTSLFVSFGNIVHIFCVFIIHRIFFCCLKMLSS